MGYFKTTLLGLSNSNDLFEDGTVVPVDKSELPIELPDDIDLNSNGNPLDNHPDWKNTIQKSTGKKA